MKMIRPRMTAPNSFKGSAEINIVEQEWGIDRWYVSLDGEEVCTPVSFFTNSRNLDWSFFA